MFHSLLSQVRELERGRGELGTGEAASVPTLKGFEAIFNNLVSVILGFAGIALFVMFLSGGFKYITAGGDPKAIEGAKKTLTYAIGGMILLALSFLILRFIENFTGAQVTQFKIFQ